MRPAPPIPITKSPAPNRPGTRWRCSRVRRSPRTKLAVSTPTRSDFHYFSFFCLQELVDAMDIVVVHFLEFFLGALLLVLGSFLEMFQMIARGGACMADRNAGLFRQLVHDFHQLLAPLLVERWQWNADDA